MGALNINDVEVEVEEGKEEEEVR